MARNDRFTSQDRKQQIYSDFLTDLNTHPVSKDVVRYVNEHAIIRSIKNLLMTNKTERLYQPNIGANITRLLFEPMGNAVASLLESQVRDTIAIHEPRAKVVEVTAVPDYDNNLYTVNVTILVINRPDAVSFNVLLTRVR